MSLTPTLTIAFAFVTVLIGVLFNNSRITDLRSSTDKRLDDLRQDMNNRFDDTNRHIDDKFNLLSERIERMNDNLLRILADQDVRLRRLESTER